MDRRTAINRIGAMLGAAVSMPTVSALMSGCAAPSDSYVPSTLLPKHYRFIGLLADTILPETDTPGAVQAGVPAFIDVLLSDFYPAPEREAFMAGIAPFKAELDGGDDWMSASPTVREERLALLDDAVYRSAPTARMEGDPMPTNAWYRRLKELVVAGYYTSEVGATQELRVMPMGPWQADVPLTDVGGTWA